MQETQETKIRSLEWEDFLTGGNGNPLQNSCLENSVDRGAWQATVLGSAKSQTQLNTHTTHTHTHAHYCLYVLFTLYVQFKETKTTIFQSVCTILHFQQQCMNDAVSLHLPQHLMLSLFLAILRGLQWYLILVLICFFNG